MKYIPILTLAAVLVAGCTSTKNGVKQYDPVKTEQVKAAVQPVVASAVRRIIENSPQHADEIALYLRAAGGAFCSASASGTIGPDQLVVAVDAATLGLQAKVDPEVIDAKNALLAIYRIAYADRYKAELPADKWPIHILDLLCKAIDQGLKDAGKPGCQ